MKNVFRKCVFIFTGCMQCEPAEPEATEATTVSGAITWFRALPIELRKMLVQFLPNGYINVMLESELPEFNFWYEWSYPSEYWLAEMSLCKWATREKHSSLLFQRLMREKCKKIRRACIQEAATRGDLTMTRFLVDVLWCILSSDVFTLAVKSESLPLLQWLMERECPVDKVAYTVCARGGNIPLMVWLHDAIKHLVNYRNLSVIYWAFMGGHMPMVEWLHEHNFPWHRETCLAEAVDNPIMTAWIHEHWNDKP